MNPLLRTTLVLATLLIGLGSSRSWAVSQSYTFDPGTGPYEYLGVGVFDLDVGEPLGVYSATGVGGGGKTFGTWGALEFRVGSGQFPSLVISNLTLTSIEFSLPAIGGKNVQVGSRADLEWLNFTGAISNVFGISIRSAPVSSVPDQGQWFPISAAALGVTVLVAQRRKVTAARLPAASS